MATELADEVTSVVSNAPQDDLDQNAPEDNQRIDYSRLWEEIPLQLDELRRLVDEELGMSDEEADELVVHGDREFMPQCGHIPDDWVALPSEVSWSPVWLERMALNNNGSEDESSSVSESDENDTRAWHDRHRRWWHPPRYVFYATRSNNRTG